MGSNAGIKKRKMNEKTEDGVFIEKYSKYNFRLGSHPSRKKHNQTTFNFYTLSTLVTKTHCKGSKLHRSTWHA